MCSNYLAFSFTVYDFCVLFEKFFLTLRSKFVFSPKSFKVLPLIFVFVRVAYALL